MQRDRVEWGDIGIRQNRVGLASVGWGVLRDGGGKWTRAKVSGVTQGVESLS